MTRKRFTKLLMSHGISRNEAVEIAADYNSRNVPYERAYIKEIRRAGDRISFAFEGLKKSSQVLGEALTNFHSVCKKAMENAANRIGRY